MEKQTKTVMNDSELELNKRPISEYILPFVPLLYAAVGVLLILVMLNSGKWPFGDDVMYHIYRGEKVYSAISHGHVWVPLDTQWYNGVELLRYWSPLPAYVEAFCQWTAGGNSMHGYLVYTWLTYFLSAMAWFLIGIRRRRPVMGTAFGFIWFFMPQNIMFYFASGNLAGMLGIACVLPWFICFTIEYLEEPGRGPLIRLALITALMGLCHSGFALLSILVMLIALLFRRLFCGRSGDYLRTIMVILLGFLLTGVWFIASRKGVGSIDYSEQFKASFQKLIYTLNPADRVTSGFGHYYFGLSIFIIAVIGLVFAAAEARSGMLTAVLICLLTSQGAYSIISLIPGSSFLWTSRMINAALAVFLFSMIEWRSLKKPLQVLMVAVIIIDCSVSFGMIAGNKNGAELKLRLNDEQNATLITEAKKTSSQRIALIDGSSLASTGAYLTSTWRGTNDSSYGAGYEASVTRKNITMLNRAAVDGCYDYLFDRALQLGDDVVLIQISQLRHPDWDLDKVNRAAGRSGYKLKDSNGAYLLYSLKRNGSGHFGTKSRYTAIAIGRNASEIAEQFPAFDEADDNDICDYSYKELSKYKTIYLDGFTMKDKAKAEGLLKKLASHGVRIVIAADGIPDKNSTDGREFLGVKCNPIKFSNGFPEFDTSVGNFNPKLFPRGSEQWNTVYLTGLDHVMGSARDNGVKLSFYGTAEDKNIVFIGFNLTYYYDLTRDRNVGRLLSGAMDVKSSDLPERSIVPLKVKGAHNDITVRSPENNVNTTLAYHDMFIGSGIKSHNNLTYVDRGTTKIRYGRPYLLQGIAVTLAAVLGIIIMMRGEGRPRKRRSQKDRPVNE